MRIIILKLQLAGLFFVSLISCFYFYFEESVSDSAYKITSASEKYSFISYYFNSFFTLVGQLTGLWTVILFIGFALLNSLYLSKRNKWYDTAILFFLVPVLVIIFNLFVPLFIGDYLSDFVNEKFDGIEIALTFVASLSILSVIFFREKISSKIRTLHFVQNIFEAKKSWDLKLKGLIQKIDSFKTKYLSKNLFSIKSFTNVFAKKNVPMETFTESESTVITEENTSTVQGIEPKQSLAFLEYKAPLSSFQNIKEKKEKEQKSVSIPIGLSHFSSEELIKSISKKGNENEDASSPREKYFEEIIARMEEKLSEFRIDAKVVNVIKGPVVDTFELELGAGVKVSRITSVTEDLGLALKGLPIRMVYPMKGKSTVGVEVPRSPREIIFLDDLLLTQEFKNIDQLLPICLGKNAFGEITFVDLASMPHMLVAGSTGSGKSVFINALLVTLLIKLPPEKLKLILIDPKQLELALYSGVPHLILPVVTDSKIASRSLIWASFEMERRYSILKEFGVRNIDGFNEKLKSATPDQMKLIKKFYGNEEKTDFTLPYLVIIVDEFADLILTKFGKEIENNICRLAAKARAAGIHLVVATQRPSVDVITGLIKSNFPTRVSFRVSSSIDSRTILTSIGAEKLLGKGDMLYKHGIEMTRLHSAFVDEKEIEKLVTKLAEIPQQIDNDVLDFVQNENDKSNVDYYSDDSGPAIYAQNDTEYSDDDELFDEAVKVVVEIQSASASLLQRRLKIGYNRAANLVEQMENKGIVGPQDGARPRKVLLRPSAENVIR